MTENAVWRERLEEIVKFQRAEKIYPAEAQAALAEFDRLTQALEVAEAGLEPWAAMDAESPRLRVTSEITFEATKNVGLEVRLYHPTWSFLDHDWTDFREWFHRAATALATVNAALGGTNASQD